MDGFTNRGGLLWGHVIAALVLTSPAPAYAGWLVAKREGSVWLRSAAVTVALAIPIVVIALAVNVLLDAASDREVLRLSGLRRGSRAQVSTGVALDEGGSRPHETVEIARCAH